jgi:hypothetical protein
MAFSGAKRVFFAAAPLFAAALLSAACEGPDAGRPAAPQQGGVRPPDHGSGMVVRCSVCRGVGMVSGPGGMRRECDNCEGKGRVKHTK